MEAARSEFASAMRRHALALRDTCWLRWRSRGRCRCISTTALPGPVSGDTGVYVWNLWVFRHAITAHREMPFFTAEILSLSSAVPLTLQNYTTLANVIAFPLLPLFGIVATFNLLVIGSGVRRGARDVRLRPPADRGHRGGVGGGTRVRVLTIHERPGDGAFQPGADRAAADLRHAARASALPADVPGGGSRRYHRRVCVPLRSVLRRLLPPHRWICDRYSAVLIQRGPLPFRPYRGTLALDVLLVCIAGLIAGMLVGGGRRIECSR